MTTRSKRRPPKRTRRSLTISYGPQHGASTHTRRHGPPVWLVIFWVARWFGRWGTRATAWTVRQGVRRTAGHVSRARHAWAAWDVERDAYGGRTLITDLFSGERVPHDEVQLDDPATGDPRVRAAQAEAHDRQRERAEQARFDDMFRHLKPTAWERWLDKVGLRRINWGAYRISRDARMTIAARRAAREAQEYAAFRGMAHSDSAAEQHAESHLDPNDDSLTTSPGPSREGKFKRHRVRGDGTVANPIRQWSDLADPSIDPFEYPAELPQHFAEVARLLTDEAAMIEAASDNAKAGADTFDGYVEYLDTAEVAPSVLSPMVDAAEAIQTAVSFIRQAAQAMADAATLAEQAQRASEDEYGDQEVPRFDKANS